MGNPRLYAGPEDTKAVLRHVIKGAKTQEELAKRLGCADRTVYNKIHDPKILGFLKSEDGEYVITDKEELMGLFQLDKREVLKKRFKQLPGVEEVNDKLNGGSMSFVEVGRLIAYYTDSEAIDEDAFVTYGRVYSNWFDYLGMGDAANQTLYRNKPPGVTKTKTKPKRGGSGSSYPRVRPEVIFNALPKIEGGVSGRSELAAIHNVTEHRASKILSTCYDLNLAEKTDQVNLTPRGEKVLDAEEKDRRELIRSALLELEIIQTYCDLAPSTRFKNQELMFDVADELGRDWTDNTIETKSKRCYQWLIYSGLFREVKRGTLVPTGEGGLDEYV